MAKPKIEIEELVYLKTSWLEDKAFMVFVNDKGEMRAIDAEMVNLPNIQPGIKLKAEVEHKGCSGREIQKVMVCEV